MHVCISVLSRILKNQIMVQLQAFIQALLSIAVFPQRVSFFTFDLVQWLCGGGPMVDTEGKFFEI